MKHLTYECIEKHFVFSLVEVFGLLKLLVFLLLLLLGEELSTDTLIALKDEHFTTGMLDTFKHRLKRAIEVASPFTITLTNFL
jgi:hypothetical protein